MAQYGQNPNQPPPPSGFYGSSDYGWTSNPPETGYSFDMSGTEFGQEQQFGSFDYNSPPQSNPTGLAQQTSASAQQPGPYDNNPYLQSQSSRYAGSIMTPGVSAFNSAATSSFDDEPPLMEELGINFDHIVQKTLAALNPLKSTDAAIMQDTDLAGPLVFCLAFGGFLLLSGKVHFGYIYGIGMMGCLAMYCLLNLMSLNGVSVGVTISILGYCLLPMVGLSGISILFSLKGLFGFVVACSTVLWCSSSASKLFVTALTMDHQQLLVAYPCALVYGVFSLLTIF